MSRINPEAASLFKKLVTMICDSYYKKDSVNRLQAARCYINITVCIYSLLRSPERSVVIALFVFLYPLIAFKDGIQIYVLVHVVAFIP